MWNFLYHVFSLQLCLPWPLASSVIWVLSFDQVQKWDFEVLSLSSANGELEHLLKTDNKFVSLVVRASVALHSVQGRPGQEKPREKILEISSNCKTTRSKSQCPKICTVAFLRVIQNLDTWGPYHQASYEVGQGRPWPGRLFLLGFWKQFLHDLRDFRFRKVVFLDFEDYLLPFLNLIFLLRSKRMCECDD